MATVQTLTPASDSTISHCRDVYPHSPADGNYIMGSVGSLVAEKSELPGNSLKRNGNTDNLRQPDGLFNKGLSQRELLNYLNTTKNGSKTEKWITPGSSSMDREHCHKVQQTEVFRGSCYKDGKEIDLTKNSLPVGGKFEKSHFRPSAFKPVVRKNFSSMQNLYPPQSKELPNSTASLNVFSKTDLSLLKNGSEKKDCFRSVSQEEDVSDSGRNSMTSLPPCGTGIKHYVGQISASMSQINHIGTNYIDGGSLRSKEASNCDSRHFFCKSMAVLRLNPLGNMLPSCELSLCMEGLVQKLEDRLHEKELELEQMRKNLDESEDAITQMFEDKQRLWKKEMEELKRVYATKLQQVTQQTQHSQRTLQLQVFKVQQEKKKLQEDFDRLLWECKGLKTGFMSYKQEQNDLNPRLEETKSEVCQKADEIVLLKQQLRDSQAEGAQKLSEIFNLKTQFREVRLELNAKDEHISLLKGVLESHSVELARRTSNLHQQEQAILIQEAALRKDSVPKTVKNVLGGETDDLKYRGLQEENTQSLVLQVERLKAELLLERRQCEAQASSFKMERSTWQEEKEKVIEYQKQLQASYLEMYQRNQILKQEIQEIATKLELTESVDVKQNLPWIERIESSEI